MHPDLFTCEHPHPFHKHHMRHGRKHHGFGHKGMKHMKLYGGLHSPMGHHHPPMHFGRHGMPMHGFGRRGMMHEHGHPFPPPFHHTHHGHHRMNHEEREPIVIKIELNANPSVHHEPPMHKHKEMKKHMKHMKHMRKMKHMKHGMRRMREDSPVDDFPVFSHSPHGHHHRRRFHRGSSV